MTAQQAKQVVKNALYRTIGETSTAFGFTPNDERTLRILMYHKVNDIPDNPTTVPVGRFDEQLSQLLDLGYQAVDLEAVIDHYTLRTPLPEKARPDHASTTATATRSTTRFRCCRSTASRR